MNSILKLQLLAICVTLLSHPITVISSTLISNQTVTNFRDACSDNFIQINILTACCDASNGSTQCCQGMSQGVGFNCGKVPLLSGFACPAGGAICPGTVDTPCISIVSILGTSPPKVSNNCCYDFAENEEIAGCSKGDNSCKQGSVKDVNQVCCNPSCYTTVGKGAE